MRQQEKSALDIPLAMARTAGEHEQGIATEAFLEVRGCVFECQAVLEILWRRKLIKDKQSDELSETLIVLANMLTDLASSSTTTRRVPIYQPPRKQR